MTRYIVIGVSLILIGVGVAFILKKDRQKTEPVAIAAKSGFTYVALGDSYTIGEGEKEANRWPNQLVDQLKDQDITLNLASNPSRTGYTTEDLLAREIEPLKEARPDFMTLLIGVNDYVQGVSSDDFDRKFKKVLNTVQAAAPQAKLLIVTIPDYGKTPTGQQFGRPESTEAGIKLYNQLIINEAARRNLPVADIFTISQESSSLGEITPDGLHPSGAQYTKWLEVITPKAIQLLKN